MFNLGAFRVFIQQLYDTVKNIVGLKFKPGGWGELNTLLFNRYN
jgi:hypothetical protein